MGVMEMPIQITVPVRARLDLLSRRCGDQAGYLDAGSGPILTWSEAARQAADWAAQLTLRPALRAAAMVSVPSGKHRQARSVPGIYLQVSDR
jgi:hypothetical protein